MLCRFASLVGALGCVIVAAVGPAPAADIKATPLFARIKASLDAVPAIDTHEHLRPFGEMPNLDATDRGPAMTLHSIFAGSYYGGINRLSRWPQGASFDQWWAAASGDFDNARATSSYRYLLPAFRDLYGVDFDTITAEQARELNDRIVANYQDDKWLIDVVTRRANIELMLVDPYWSRLQFARAYQFSVPVLNVTEIMRGSHREKLADVDSPYVWGEARDMKISTLDDYLAVVEKIFAAAVAADAVCLKSTQAYQRTLRYENVPRQRAAEVFGKSPAEITPAEQQDFEDFMFWHVTSMSAKFELPFQIHTGHGRLQGSSPMMLLDLIQANPQTKFILFHGGFPWVGETAAIAMRHRNVWIDSVWLPTLSYTMAKRAYQEWLEIMPSDRIMWGADTVQAEGIYAATEVTRQCLAEALAEKVDRGELREADALRIGRQILRDNALALFPKLKRQLWRKDEATKNAAGAN
ncbi:MAG: amidohydrolase family protein [Pirellulales bacterium]